MREVQRIGIADREREAFTALGALRPTDFPFDLATKALLAWAVLFLGLYGLRTELVDPADRERFLIFALLAAARLTWLAVASLRRGAGVGWLALPSMILLIAGYVAAPIDRVFDDKGLPADRALSLELGLRQDLSGVDLRGRDLSRFYLYGKDLSHANLSQATLKEAVLVNARLRGADLSQSSLSGVDLSGADLRGADLSGAELLGDVGGADLRGADLRGATLGYTDLDGAHLCGADLRGADLEGAEGQPYVDARTRWPARGGHPNLNPEDDGC